MIRKNTVNSDKSVLASKPCAISATTGPLSKNAELRHDETKHQKLKKYRCKGTRCGFAGVLQPLVLSPIEANAEAADDNTATDDLTKRTN